MSKQNWVDPFDVALFQPGTAEELLERRADIALIQGEDTDPAFWDWAPAYFPSFWLFYLDGEPVGYIRRDFFKRSVELHGKVRDGYAGRGIAHFAVLACLNHTFFVMPRNGVIGYPKVTIAVPDGNKYAWAFAIRWGFTRKGRDGGKSRWVLKRDDFLRIFKSA